MTPAPTSLASRTCVVILTYGTRHHFLKQVLERVATFDVGAIVVVFNGNYIAGAIPAGMNVNVVDHRENLGSAGGYSAGIRSALQLGFEYLYLLDDDNLPREDCMVQLALAHHALDADQLVALQAFRPSQPWQRIAATDGVMSVGRPNTFGWFHWANERYLLRRQLGAGQASRKVPVGTIKPQTRIDMGAYGGLFLHRNNLIPSVMPDARYFCYYDDLDFTNRLVRLGLKLYLCSDAIVDDLEDSWHVNSGRMHPLFAPDTSDLRVFLDLRNAFIFNRSRITSRAIYLFNGIGFWLGIAYLAMFRSADISTTRRRLELIRRAVKYGSRGEFISISDDQTMLTSI